MPALDSKPQGPENVRRTVEVLFDPSQVAADPFSFVPERVELNRSQETAIEFILTTRNENGRRATFPTSEFITWEEGVMAHAEATLDPDKTRARLRVSTDHSGEDRGPYPYHVSAEYGGRLYKSSGYPVGDPPPAC